MTGPDIEVGVDVVAAALLESEGAAHSAGLLALAFAHPRDELVGSLALLAIRILHHLANLTATPPLELLGEIATDAG